MKRLLLPTLHPAPPQSHITAPKLWLVSLWQLSAGRKQSGHTHGACASDSCERHSTGFAFGLAVKGLLVDSVHPQHLDFYSLQGQIPKDFQVLDPSRH